MAFDVPGMIAPSIAITAGPYCFITHMEQILQSLVPDRPLLPRTIKGRTALPVISRVDGLSRTQAQPAARKCTHVSSVPGGAASQNGFSFEVSRSEQAHAALIWSRRISSLPSASSRDGSEACPSSNTPGHDEDLGTCHAWGRLLLLKEPDTRDVSQRPMICGAYLQHSHVDDWYTGLTMPASDALPAGTPELYDNTEAERTLLQLGTRWREMTKQPGGELPPEAGHLQQQQISQLSVSMRQARMRSTVELLGRKQLAPGEDLPLTPADPASRILEALLSVPDQAERLHMLTEALQAPDPATPTAEEDLEIELLWTTPVRLLQAIDLALLRMQRPVDGPPADDRLLGDSGSEAPRDLQKDLQVLRDEVFRIWDSAGATD